MSSVTVKFHPSNTSQSELLLALRQAMRMLENDGVLQNVKVEAVFPGDETDLKGAFVVSFNSTAPAKVAARLNALPGVGKAYVAPARSELGTRPQ